MISGNRFPAGSGGAEDKVGKDCTFKGKQLWRRVQFVTSGADVNVEIVSLASDLRVKGVTAFASVELVKAPIRPSGTLSPPAWGNGRGNDAT